MCKLEEFVGLNAFMESYFQQFPAAQLPLPLHAPLKCNSFAWSWSGLGWNGEDGDGDDDDGAILDTFATRMAIPICNLFLLISELCHFTILEHKWKPRKAPALDFYTY